MEKALLWASLALNIVFVFLWLRDRYYMSYIEERERENEGGNSREKIKKAMYSPKEFRHPKK